MATKTQSDAPVLIDELAGRLTGSVDGAHHWIKQVGGSVDVDWAGRSVVSPATAKKALTAFRNHAAEEATLQSEYDSYSRARRAELHSAGEEAFQRAGAAEFEREHQALRGSATIWVGLPQTLSPAGMRVAQEAADAARARFEREHPFLTFEEFAVERRRQR